MTINTGFVFANTVLVKVIHNRLRATQIRKTQTYYAIRVIYAFFLNRTFNIVKIKTNSNFVIKQRNKIDQRFFIQILFEKHPALFI